MDQPVQLWGEGVSLPEGLGLECLGLEAGLWQGWERSQSSLTFKAPWAKQRVTDWLSSVKIWGGRLEGEQPRTAFGEAAPELETGRKSAGFKDGRGSLLQKTKSAQEERGPGQGGGTWQDPPRAAGPANHSGRPKRGENKHGGV